MFQLDLVPQATSEQTPSEDGDRKAELGQFMTPASIAAFMASLFPQHTHRRGRLLDAGAGRGSLTSAFIERWRSGGLGLEALATTAYEFDPSMRVHLEAALSALAGPPGLETEVVAGDFIEHAARSLLSNGRLYTHAILNPPYKKLTSDSDHRQLLRRVGIETVNLYSAFIALSIGLLEHGGHLVAIVPRSFCNGPYYRPFRFFMLQRAALRQIHLFESRTDAFKEDRVLQENVIIVLERGGEQAAVKVTTSKGSDFADLSSVEHPFDRIVKSGDNEGIIHIPTTTSPSLLELSKGIQCSLPEIGLTVSTGPVVDFRLREHLRQTPDVNTVPLLYPLHFTKQKTEWPKDGAKKPNAICLNQETKKWLYPNGFYCVVRRLSSKEEKRRIVATVVNPASFSGAEFLGFENHLNVFHDGRRGLTEELARGLAAFLNTSAVDDAFRQFNGHTQVNATDLRAMKYPSRTQLVALGALMKQEESLGNTIDEESIMKACA